MIQPKVTTYVVHISSGAYVDIPATIWCRKVKIVEEAVAGGGQTVLGQGLQAKFPGDSFTAVHTYDPGEPIILGGDASRPLLGKNAQTDCFNRSIAATVLCKLLSMNAATNVRVEEWS